MTIRHASWILSVAYTIALGALMVRVGGPQNATWFLIALPMLAWAAGPIALFTLFIRKFTSARARAVLLVGQILFALGSGYGYYDAFFTHPDAQSGLVFIFLPLWGYVEAGVLAGVVRVFASQK